MGCSSSDCAEDIHCERFEVEAVGRAGRFVLGDLVGFGSGDCAETVSEPRTMRLAGGVDHGDIDACVGVMVTSDQEVSWFSAPRGGVELKLHRVADGTEARRVADGAEGVGEDFMAQMAEITLSSA